jgi:hypothetical protein
MQKYGLQRGIRGLEARNITTQQFYRELYVENEHLKEDIQEQKQEQQEVYEKVRDLYDRKDEAREKFIDIDKHVRDKKEELATVEAKLQKAKQDYEPYRAQEELTLIHELFPMMKEQLSVADFCCKIGLIVESIKALFAGKVLTTKSFSFSFFSPEHKQKFTTEDVKLKIDNEPDNSNKLRLNLNGVNILDWFRQKFQEVQFSKKPEINRSRGIKM